MFWKRTHPQKQRQVARPSFRPQLECLEDRALLDSSGAFATLGTNLRQVVADSVNGNLTAVQKDATKVEQAAINVINQIGSSNIPADVETVLWGAVVTQIGQDIVLAGGATVEAGGAGGLLIAAGLPIYAYGVKLQITGMQHLIEDWQGLGQHRQSQSTSNSTPTPTPTPTPNASSDVGTWSGTLVPDNTGGFVEPSTLQKVTLTINANGSAVLSIKPFDGSLLAVRVPAGQVGFYDDGSARADYTNLATGSQVRFWLSPNGLEKLQGQLSAGTPSAFDPNTFDSVYFDSAILNRQG